MFRLFHWRSLSLSLHQNFDHNSSFHSTKINLRDCHGTRYSEKKNTLNNLFCVWNSHENIKRFCSTMIGIGEMLPCFKLFKPFSINELFKYFLVCLAKHKMHSVAEMWTIDFLCLDHGFTWVKKKIFNTILPLKLCSSTLSYWNDFWRAMIIY